MTNRMKIIISKKKNENDGSAGVIGLHRNVTTTRNEAYYYYRAAVRYRLVKIIFLKSTGKKKRIKKKENTNINIGFRKGLIKAIQWK